MKFKSGYWVLILLPAAPALQAQVHNDAMVLQSSPSANEAYVEQRNNARAVASLKQSGGADAGSAGARPGILQTDGGRLSAVVTQQGDAAVSVTQQRTDLGWATVMQQGRELSARILEKDNVDVTADIRQWNVGNQATQLQSSMFNGTADSWQSGDRNTNRIEQNAGRVVIGFVLQEGSFGDATLLQNNVSASAVHIRQAGTFARASVEQHDGINLNATIRQTAGSNQYAVLEQSGMNMNADITQRGAGQLAGARQR